MTMARHARARKRKPEKTPAKTLLGRAEQKVEQILELPVGAISSNARLEVLGNRQAIVEGCKGILEYDQEVIRLHTDTGILRFCGRNLSLNCLTEDSAVVSGYIMSIEFL